MNLITLNAVHLIMLSEEGSCAPSSLVNHIIVLVVSIFNWNFYTYNLSTKLLCLPAGKSSCFIILNTFFSLLFFSIRTYTANAIIMLNAALHFSQHCAGPNDRKCSHSISICGRSHSVTCCALCKVLMDVAGPWDQQTNENMEVDQRELSAVHIKT